MRSIKYRPSRPRLLWCFLDVDVLVDLERNRARLLGGRRGDLLALALGEIVALQDCSSCIDEADAITSSESNLTCKSFSQINSTRETWRI